MATWKELCRLADTANNSNAAVATILQKLEFRGTKNCKEMMTEVCSATTGHLVVHGTL